MENASLFQDVGTSEKRKIYAVTEITRRIKSVLENELGHIWVEGELSNVRQPSSGHLYFTMKDASAQIRGVMFKGSQRGLSFQLKDGLKVRAYGQVTVYERSGDYQLLVRKMEEAGKGDLQAAFETLKEKLHEEGLFSPERKQSIPTLPQHVGVVTSPTGAAIRDILNVIHRRFPNLHIVIAPVKVQGEGAAEQIAHAIDYFNKVGGLDVIIIGRGGGSLEDLWCFNEECVARAVARSQIPVISAVGHEIDFTISDFVADLRAPTPSAAAELVVGCKDAFEEALRQHRRHLEQALQQRLLHVKNRFIKASRSYVFREPENLVKQMAQRIDRLKLGMQHALVGMHRQHQQFVDEVGMKMAHHMQMHYRERREVVQRLNVQLKALNPMNVLERGYSFVRNARGEVIKDVDQVDIGETILTQMAHGRLESTVTEKKEVSNGTEEE